MCSKTKQFAVKFRQILEVFALRGLWRKFWVHFQDLYVQKWSCFLWSSDRFLKFFACKVYRKIHSAISLFMCPKTELFAIKVETHFGSFCFARFMKKVLDAFSRFMCPKMKLFPAKFRRILEVFTLRGLWKKFWAHYHDLCVQKRSCLPWSSDAFCKFSPCKLYEESYGCIFTILRPIIKLFAVALRRILEVLRIQGLKKMSGCIF